MHGDRALGAELLTTETAYTLFGLYPRPALDHLSGLRGCEVHSTVILAQVDDNVFKKLGMNLTCEPVHQTKKLYHK